MSTSIDDDDEYDKKKRQREQEKWFGQRYTDFKRDNNSKKEDQENALNSKIDSGEKSDETSINLDSSFSCEKCNTNFTSREELNEHYSSAH